MRSPEGIRVLVGADVSGWRLNLSVIVR